MIYKNRIGSRLKVNTAKPYRVLEKLGPSWGFANFAVKVVGTVTYQGPSDGVYLWLSDEEKLKL